MSTKLVSTGVQFPDDTIQTTSTTGGSTTFDGMSDTTVSATDPAIDTNPSATGHIWLNKTSGEYYICTTNTTDENVWVNIGEGEDGVAPIPPVWYGDRGVFAGGYDGAYNASIDYITISSTGNASDFGDLAAGHSNSNGLSSGSRGIFAGGATSSSDVTNVIEYIVFATTGNTTDWGDLHTALQNNPASLSNGSRGIIAGGYTASAINNIQYFVLNTTGNASDFGDLSEAKYGLSGTADSTRGLIAGGYSSSLLNTIEYITIATTGNTTDFGDLTYSRYHGGGLSDTTRSVFYSGGYNTNNVIDYVTTASTGNATDFGDSTQSISGNRASTASSTRGVSCNGVNNVIEYITIQSTGNATDFGDLTIVRRSGAGAAAGT